MRRHRFDPLSFTFGLAFLVFAALASVRVIGFSTTYLRWFGAGFLLLLGALMVLTSRRRDRS